MEAASTASAAASRAILPPSRAPARRPWYHKTPPPGAVRWSMSGQGVCPGGPGDREGLLAGLEGPHAGGRCSQRHKGANADPPPSRAPRCRRPEPKTAQTRARPRPSPPPAPPARFASPPRCLQSLRLRAPPRGPRRGNRPHRRRRPSAAHPQVPPRRPQRGRRPRWPRNRGHRTWPPRGSPAGRSARAPPRLCRGPLPRRSSTATLASAAAAAELCQRRGRRCRLPTRCPRPQPASRAGRAASEDRGPLCETQE
mmetsp:Transcript_14500/g.46561  ORF Transcript_14500/g.46561 Transcript_14500/m.46561 type:complete len:255 (-) Transcript_14500:228-992(-)